LVAPVGAAADGAVGERHAVVPRAAEQVWLGPHPVARLGDINQRSS
jgi:hypothetical protein